MKGNNDDLTPDEQDIRLSFELDQKVNGRPLYYVIMNKETHPSGYCAGCKCKCPCDCPCWRSGCCTGYPAIMPN